MSRGPTYIFHFSFESVHPLFVDDSGHILLEHSLFKKLHGSWRIETTAEVASALSNFLPNFKLKSARGETASMLT